MGWKNVKEYYRIEHIVCVSNGCICIGSPYIHDLIKIGPSGEILKPYRDHHNEDLTRYMEEIESDPEKLRSLVLAPDVFEAAHTVYTYSDGEIIEKKCEVLGWPNVTHDGELMYENTYSPDKDKVIKWAEKDITLYVKEIERQCDEVARKLKEKRDKLAELKANKTRFLQVYPHAQNSNCI